MKAAIVLLALLCAGCVETNHAKEPEYVCTDSQRRIAQDEALREIAIRKVWSSFSRNAIYQESVARNCEVRP